MWKVILFLMLIAFSGQFSAAMSSTAPAEAANGTESPTLSPAPDAIVPWGPEAPLAAGEEERQKEEYDEDDDFHPAFKRPTSAATLIVSTGNTPRGTLALIEGHPLLWPLPPDAN